jgi:hypothetical protein
LPQSSTDNLPVKYNVEVLLFAHRTDCVRGVAEELVKKGASELTESNQF